MEEIINVQIIDMDVMIPEQVTRNSDGSYTVFLNARFTHEHRLLSYEHALNHIKSGDFDRESGDIQQLEAIAHNMKVTTSTRISVSASEERKQRILSQIRKKRKKAEKKLKEYEEDMKVINFSEDEAFDRAELQWLYGNDL